MFPYLGVMSYPNSWLAMWQRFDANWYLSIAESGYQSYPGTEHFPPFYPLLISLTSPIFGIARRCSGVTWKVLRKM